MTEQQARDEGILIVKINGGWFWRPAENVEYEGFLRRFGGLGRETKREALADYVTYKSEMI